MKYKSSLILISYMLFSMSMAQAAPLTSVDKPFITNRNNCTYPASTELINAVYPTEEEVKVLYQNVDKGNVYAYGSLITNLTKKYPKQAICWQKNLADTGKTEYQNDLAYQLATGDKSIIDISQAINLYNQVLAKDPTNLAANLSLGVFYANGYGVAKDNNKAFNYFLNATNQKNAEELHYIDALLKVATAYHYGLGTATNPQKALTYYQSILTGNYKLVVNKNAELYYEEQFLAQAQLYETGLGGTKDLAKAAENYFMAAIKNNNTAQYKMSELYRTGQGLPQDLDNAKSWLEIAKRNQRIEAYSF